MLKIVRFALIAGLAAILVTSVASAQDKQDAVLDTFLTYYTTNSADLTTEPGTGGGWLNTFPYTIDAADSLWFGTQNTYVPVNRKKYWLELKGAAASDLTAVEARGYIDASTQVDFTSAITKETITGGVKFHVVFRPQPEWEVILVKNNTGSSIEITGAVGTSDCVKVVPSLTTYGIIVLVLLLLVSTVWVIRKKKAGVPA